MTRKCQANGRESVPGDQARARATEAGYRPRYVGVVRPLSLRVFGLVSAEGRMTGQHVPVFTVLGPVGFEVAGRRFSVQRAQTRGQLGVLCLCAGSVVSFNALVEAIWGGAAPASARNQVHGAMHVIRDRLVSAGAPGVLAGGPYGYRLDVPAEQVDAGRFERCVGRAVQRVRAGEAAEAIEGFRSALALWRGEPLADASGAYVEGARAGLVERRLLAVEELAELELAAGRAEVVVADLGPFVHGHPLRERLRLLLMRALQRVGRRADALAVYRDYRQVLVEREGLDPGAEITELMIELLRTDCHAEPVRKEPVRAAAPAQLPADVVGFSGRVVELAALDRVLAERERGGRPSAVCVVIGPGGIGKTALAVHWGHRIAGQFRDGVLYVDLQGGGLGQPLEPAAVLEGWLRTLGMDADRIPAATADRTAMLRTELAARRVLLVLDNAESTRQVRPLLPGAGGSAVVITSRHRLDSLTVADGAVPVELSGLPDADAVALVRITSPVPLAEADAPQLAALVRMCDGFPLALRIAAARLGGARSMPLPALLVALADEDRRLAELAVGRAEDEVAVAASFGASYARSSSAAQRMFRAIGAHFGPRPSLAACSATAGLPPARARAALEELVEAHLVQRDGDRFATHDLLRLYARDRAAAGPVAEYAEAVQRCLDWYRAAAHAADLLLRPAGQYVGADRPTTATPPELGSEEAALHWLDTEADNLVAAVRLGIRVAPALSWRLCASLLTWLQRRAPRSTYIDLNTLAVAAAAAEGHLAGEALLANGLGVAHALVRDVERATVAFDRSYRRRLELGDRRSAAVALMNLGALLADAGDPAAAVSRLRDARELFLELADDRDICVAECNLGFAHQRAGHSAEALDWFGRAWAAARDINYRAITGHADVGMAEVYERDGDPANAARHFARALPALRAEMDKVQVAWAVHGLGRTRLALGQVAAAQQSLQEALDLYEDLGDPTAETVRAQLADLAARR